MLILEAMDILRIDSLTKDYLYGRRALHGIDLTLEENSSAAVFGRDGAGKTTLLKCVAGLESPTGGGIYFGDASAADVPVKDRNISMTFPDALSKGKTVYDNLYFSFGVRGEGKELFEERLREADRFFDIHHLYFKKIVDLDPQKKAAVAFVRCLIRDARLYIFDNPLSGFTREEKEDFILRFKAYRSFKKERGAVLYASDDFEEIRFLNFETLILNCGFGSACGTLADLYKRPPNIYVCELFGFNVLKLGGSYTAVRPEDMKALKNPEGFGYSGEKISCRFLSESFAPCCNTLYFGHSDGLGFFSVRQSGEEPKDRFSAGEEVFLSYGANEALYYDSSGQSLEDRAPDS